MLFTLDSVYVIVLSYLLGSIPFGLVITYLSGHGDIRKIGSGNIGATNVLRTGNKLLALLTFLGDSLKAVAACLLVKYIFGNEFLPLAAIFSVFGHLFPVWLKFRGGKGVATAIGVYFVLSWQIGLIIVFIWVAVAFLTRYSSLSSLVAVGLAPVFAYKLTTPPYFYAMIVLAFFIYLKHIGNIQRLLTGTESKIGQKRRK
ncbi:MAG: glycerol-3-phosphate 1-O-acyltransferase PlsY [Alphaproteobacteria bacterium]|nr:glycerol-3-phosphate 1-O-acyltransferase PlsY [Alphaproteobacteria bacterium]